MATKIIINPDDTISLEKSHAGWLSAVIAESCAKQVNLLNREELIAVVWAVKASPFPLGQGEQVYRNCLKNVKKQEKENPIAPNVTLGQIRKSIATRASHGCNAPNDSYLRIAYDIKSEASVRGY
jgi:hypothetical protein